ncbi:MAG: hypothetical protein GY874_08110 [Desulfobacteraceae bacterium]|nr:hypothetical protein [Desulfobacteraceae bacterium]
MTLDSTNNPYRPSSDHSVHQSGQNNNDNRIDQSNQRAKRLTSLKNSHFPKAHTLKDNQNFDKEKTSVSRFKKIKQTLTDKFLPQNEQNKLLFFAADIGDATQVKRWVDAGADVNWHDKDAVSALHAAARNGHVDAAKVLLSHFDIEVNWPDKDGWTPLYWAANNGHADVVIELLSHPNIATEQPNYERPTSLYAAAKNGHLDVVKVLYDQEGPPDRKYHYVNTPSPFRGTALKVAARNGRVDVVIELLSHPKIDIDDAKEFLDEFVANDNADFIQAIVIKGCSKEVLKYLRDKANEAGKPQLLEILKGGKVSDFFSGYSNTVAFGGHNKAYNGNTDVPKGILDIVKNYLYTH